MRHSGAVVSTIASQRDCSLFESPGTVQRLNVLPGFSQDTLTSSLSPSTTGYLKLSFVVSVKGSLFLRANIAPERRLSHPHARQQWSEEWFADVPPVPKYLQLHPRDNSAQCCWFYLQVPHDDLIMFMQNCKTQEWSSNNAAGAELTLTFCARWGKHVQTCGETLSYTLIFCIPWKLLGDLDCTYKLKTKQKLHTTDDVCIK